MPPEEEQTQELASATVAEAAGADAAGVDASRADATAAPVADPFASTLSMRPEAAAAAASAPTAAEATRVGRELGAVRLLREIGRGATGSVYLGHHTVLGRDVAVKFLVNVCRSAEERKGLKRFLDEARAAAAVRHPHLTQIYHADVDDADGTPYLVLEYVRGPTLKQLLDQTGPLDVAAAVAVVCDAAAAVHELHVQGLIHRDIKPSNVLLDRDGRVFVTDFGLALRQSHAPAGAGAAAGAGTGAVSEFAGTPAYMAPEMFDGRVSPRSDVYALGVMTFQLLTGSVPYSGDFQVLRDRHAREPLPADALRGAGAGPALVEVLERATNKQPMFRYKTPTDLGRALKQAAACEAAEFERARKRLCDSIAGRRAFAASEGPLSPSLAQEAAEERPGSSSYPEMLARFATIRRERRTHQPGDSDGSSVGPAAPVLIAGDTAAVPAPSDNPDANAALASPLPPPNDAPPPIVPGPILAASVLGILYGSLLAAWAFGEAIGVTAGAVPALGPRTSSAPISIALWRVLVAATSLVLATVLVAASAGCFKMRPWARRLMVRYAAVDVLFQLLVLLTVLAWAGPAMANAMGPPGATLSPSERTALELSVYVAWLVRWLALTVFPAAVLGVMTRPPVRRAFSEPAAG